MRRFPLWLKIAIPILLVFALVVATATRMVLETLPAHTQQVIEERFSEQFDSMRQLADSNPIDPCSEMDVDAIMKQLDAIRAWQEQVEIHGQLFADPVIFGAQVGNSCGGSSNNFNLKALESGAPLWTMSGFDPPEEWPAVTLWYSGMRSVVLYENRISESPDREVRLRLYLDLEDLDLGE